MISRSWTLTSVVSGFYPLRFPSFPISFAGGIFFSLHDLYDVVTIRGIAGHFDDQASDLGNRRDISSHVSQLLEKKINKRPKDRCVATITLARTSTSGHEQVGNLMFVDKTTCRVVHRDPATDSNVLRKIRDACRRSTG